MELKVFKKMVDESSASPPCGFSDCDAIAGSPNITFQYILHVEM